MGPFLIQVLEGFWFTLAAMSPYLLFGFLIAGLLSVLVPPSLVERHLGGRGLWPVIKASFFGVPLPLCSCGVIPVAASLRRPAAREGAAREPGSRTWTHARWRGPGMSPCWAAMPAPSGHGAPLPS